MPDITGRNDIEKIMAAFYDKLLKDSAISYIFIEVAKIDLEKHLPHIVDFWEQNLLNTGNYSNNVLKIHFDLNDKIPLTAAHFTIWLNYFYETIDSLFSGEKAEMMKTRALSIATVMQIKLQSRN